MVKRIDRRTTPQGGVPHRSNFNDGPWRAAVTAGVPAGRETGFHQLRHYFASAALANGVDIRSLAAYLGHTDPGFTLRMYVHLMPDADDRLRLAIDRVFTSSDGPATAREAGR